MEEFRWQPTPPALAVTAEEVADFLAVSEAWVAEQARAGDIPAIKLGRYWRFRMSEIEDVVDSPAVTTYKRRLPMPKQPRTRNRIDQVERARRWSRGLDWRRARRLVASISASLG